jgi:uncharacterized protein
MTAHSRALHADPRSPFVLDLRELGRRPGAMRRVQRTIDAPAEWQLGLVSVPAGSPAEVDLRLESVMDGVLVTGTVRAAIAAECGRCLEPVRSSLEVEVQELFAYAPSGTDDEEPLVDGDFVDIEELLRDAVVLGLPLNPVCDEACVGLCVTCGARLADAEPDHHHDDVDPRWAALAGLHPDDQNPETES